jgi:hypothetical protein
MEADGSDLQDYGGGGCDDKGHQSANQGKSRDPSQFHRHDGPKGKMSGAHGSGEFGDDCSGLSQGRRSRRMRPLEATKEILILMPEDDPVDVFGLDKNELPEFNSCMEEQYEWIPEEEKGGADGHGSHHDEHTDTPAQTSRCGPLHNLGISGGFKFNAGSSSGHGGTAVAIVGPRPKEEHIDIATPGITRITPVVGSNGIATDAHGICSSSSSIARGNSASTSSSHEVVGLSYSQYDADIEDDLFLNFLVSIEKSDRNDSGTSIDVCSSGGKKRASKAQSPYGTALTKEMANSMTMAMLSDMIMVMERDMELSKRLESHRNDIKDAVNASEKMIASFDAVVELSEYIDDFKRSDPNEYSSTIEAAIKYKTKLDKLTNKQDRSSLSSVSMATTSGGASGTESSAIGKKDEDELPAMTLEEVKELLPVPRACRLLVRVYRHHIRIGKNSVTSGKQSSSSFSSSSALSSDVKIEDDAVISADEDCDLEKYTPLFLAVYSHWTSKRAGRKSSLLRCYHNFIMENWKKQDLLPQLPEDSDADAMLKAHDQLLKLRKDLDKARLIMDRVRRREKVKRDLVKVAGNAMESFLDDIRVVEEVPEKKVKKTSAIGAASSVSSSKTARQPRAAKIIAKAKLQNPGGIENGHSPHAPLYDYAEITKAPFTLEEIDYKQLEVSLMEESSSGRDVKKGLSGLDIPDMGSKDQYYNDYAPRRSASSSSSSSSRSPRFNVSSPSNNNSSTSGWTSDEDRLLLMGVAACGVGRWTEIREDFLLARNSAQMNQRFTRLARRRCDLVKLNAKPKKRKNSEADDDDDDEDNLAEYSDVRTAYMSPQDVAFARSKLPPLIQTMLEDYDEDSVWEGIALRHLHDQGSKDKRCGRPQKYPLPIPIPKHLQNGGHLNKTKSIIQRPSELGFNWKGSNGGWTNYQQVVHSSAVNHSPTGGNQRKTSPTGKPRGRPPKKDAPKSQSFKGLKGKSGDDCDIDDMVSIGSWTDQVEAEKVKEQSLSREERIKARDKLTDAIAAAALKTLSETSNEKDRKGVSARCSLGSLSPGDKGSSGSCSKDNKKRQRTK